MADTQSNQQNTKTYSAGIMSQSFWFVEFKKYLKLISEGYMPEQIKVMVIQENLFGSPNEYRAKRIFGYISTRAAHIDEKGIELFFSSDLATQKLLNLICIIRQDRLFFEFINEVYREKAIIGTNVLEASDASIFFRNKEVQSEAVAEWTDGTKKRVQSCYFNFLTDANLLTVVDKKKTITPPLLDIALERYLEASGETSIVKAITGVF
ncbi:MAG: DUF1819 family protein [Ruminococcaceae bacterium]|nr:DUF1819 family protein [Oscillospiraceae bacterium]